MKQISFPNKILVCLIGSLVASIATQRIIFRTLWEFKNKWVPPLIFVIIPVAFVLLSSLFYSFYWHQKEKNGSLNSPRILASWQGVIRYFIAIDLSMIGWQKIFHLQFFTPLGILDEPLSSFSGEALTWAYFGHSYGYTVIVGLLQIGGSYLLLFKRTRLFGSIIIFPVMLNIVFIDFFYELAIGELAHALILLIGILYLLLQNYNQFVLFLFGARKNISSIDFKRKFFKYSIRFSVISIPLLLILSYSPRDKNPQLTGKYKIQDLLVNHKKTVPTSCNDSVLTTIYFDKGNDIVFEYNNQGRRLLGTYEFNPANKLIKAYWRYPLNTRDTLSAKLDHTNMANQLLLTGKLGNDSLEAILLKNK